MKTSSMALFFVSLLVIAAAACAPVTPRWTPATVAPPTTPPAELPGVEPIEQHTEPVEGASATTPETALPLTRDAAILTSLLNNRSIEVARLGPRIAATYVPEARAAFDPYVTGSISTGRANSPQEIVSTTSGSGSRISSGGTPTSLQSAAEIVAQIQALLKALDTSDTLRVTTEDTKGSLALQQTLPTGTTFFLTGTGSAGDSSLSDEEYQGEWSLGLTQPLLEGAGTSVNLVALRQAKNRVAQGEYALKSSLLETVGQVEIAYWNLVLAEEVLKIREFGVKLADEQLKRNEEWFRVGKGIEGDVMAAQAEKASREADLTDAQAAIRSHTISLVRLLNPQVTEPWKMLFQTMDPPEIAQVGIDPNASEELALAYRPELAEAKLDLANADLDAVRAKNNLLPRLDLVTTYGHESRGDGRGGLGRFLDDDEYDNYRIGVQFQTPILNRAERGRYQRSKLATEQVEKTLAYLEQFVGAEVRQAANEAQRQWDRITASDKEVESRKEQLRVAEGRNAAGKTTNLDLLLVQRDFIQAGVDGVTARVRYIQALTLLYAAEGTLLERRGVTLDMVESRDRRN